MQMDMGTGTSTGAMATSTAMSSDMDGTSMAMGMSDMIMAFFTSYRTPLFSATWTPESEGQYAGTCIFLITLAFILRLLLAFKPLIESRVWSAHMRRHGDGDRLLAQQDSYDKRDPAQLVAAIGGEFGSRWRGWRVGPSAARATYELLIAGIGYLLCVLLSQLLH